MYLFPLLAGCSYFQQLMEYQKKTSQGFFRLWWNVRIHLGSILVVTCLCRSWPWNKERQMCQKRNWKSKSCCASSLLPCPPPSFLFSTSFSSFCLKIPASLDERYGLLFLLGSSQKEEGGGICEVFGVSQRFHKLQSENGFWQPHLALLLKQIVSLFWTASKGHQWLVKFRTSSKLQEQ